MHILLCNKHSLAYFIPLLILILFPWNEKVPVSGVGQWIVCLFYFSTPNKIKGIKSALGGE